MMNKLLTFTLPRLLMVFFLSGSTIALAATEAPDVMVKRLSQEVLKIAKADSEIQAGNQKKVQELVDAKILPHVDFERMTMLAAGRHWREANSAQREKLTNEFRSLLVYTYSGAISQVSDQKLVFRPLRAPADAKRVEVRSQVLQPRGEPIQINYRLQDSADGWKIFDINIMGAWLVESYKGSFASEISKGGIDGLIQTLTERNKRLAGKTGSAS